MDITLNRRATGTIALTAIHWYALTSSVCRVISGEPATLNA